MTRAARQDWVDAGLRVLRDEGDAAITIDKLCASLGKTKGSFYHHFADFDAFLVALLTSWEHELTDRVIALAEAEPTKRERGARLDEVVAALDHALDRAVRAWGLRDARARAAVVRVDKRRIAYLELLLRDDGHRRPALVAQLEYVAFLGLQHLDAVDKPGARRALDVAMRRALAGLR